MTESSIMNAGMLLHTLYRVWTLSHHSSQANCRMTNGYCSMFSNVILSSSGFSLCLLLFFPFGAVASSRVQRLATSCRAISSSMAMPTIYGEKINFQVFSPSPHSRKSYIQMWPTLKWRALEKENQECAAAYHMYQPDMTYFELKPQEAATWPSRASKPHMTSKKTPPA